MADQSHDSGPLAQRKTARKAGPLPQTDIKRTIDMGALQGSIGYHMRRAQIAIFQDIIKAFAADDIRPAQYSAMLLIDSNPGLNQSELASALGIKRTNFVSMIDSLEARGLATRTPTLVDRRSHALYLTPVGEALVAKLKALQSEHEERVLARIGAQNADVLLGFLKNITALAVDDLIED